MVIPLNRVYCKLSIYDKLPVCLIKHDFCNICIIIYLLFLNINNQ